MAKLLKTTKKKRIQVDQKKEAIFKDLSQSLQTQGYIVRREELKRGSGWRAVSGSCRCDDKRFIFVDRRLSQNEQIEFLQSKLLALGVERVAG
jgi:hypothetical protein